MTVCSRGMFVGKLAMSESRSCVLLRLFVLAGVRDDGPPDGDDARQRGGERPPDGDAHPLDASVSVPFTLLLLESKQSEYYSLFSPYDE
jgi:hypothetical protein